MEKTGHGPKFRFTVNSGLTVDLHTLDENYFSTEILMLTLVCLMLDIKQIKWHEVHGSNVTNLTIYK